jgi:ribonucleoside-diphosphate reductase alpha chain
MAEDRVTKRNGELENTSFDKILNRVKNLGKGDLNVNYTSLVQKIIDRLYDKIPTSEIDELTAQQCASLSTTHPDYGSLASRIMISNHQKNTPKTFRESMSLLYNFRDVNDKHCPIINIKLWLIVCNWHEKIENMIRYERDYLFDYFGFKTLERAYLMKVNDKIVERPQHLIMRVALALHGEDLPSVNESYKLMSEKYFTHATPTLFNAGTIRQQLSSCYLIAMESDSIKGIYNTLADCASISKWAGGIGMHIHNVRGQGSHIRGTNGTSNGIVPMLRVFNNTARYCDQCITPETYIYTTEGPQQIQFCTNDTIIFNNSNKPERIQNVLEHPYNGDILSIETMHSIEPLNITDEHPIFVLKSQKGANYNVIKNRLTRNSIQPIWDEAKNLTDKDFVIYNIPKFEKDIPSISEEDCYMYGVILGDGCISNTRTTCYVSLHKTEKKYILDKIMEYFDNKCIRYSIKTENNTCRIIWSKNTILPFKYGEIYDINKEKNIHSRWLNLPLQKSKYILKGLVDTDGCKRDELTFVNTSRNVVESMKYLFLKMGVLTSGYIRDRITNKKISYCLRIPKTEEVSKLMNIEKGKFFKFFQHNNYLFSRIKNINKTTYEGTLYDLQMEHTHNYMIHNGIVHNGGGRRKGSFAIYLEPWHADIDSFLDMKKNHGDEEQRARDLFYALWIPDLFMKRVKSNSMWTLMCPDKCPGLSDVYGDEFVQLYEKYESEGKGTIVKARDIWLKILDSQIETGTPYILYKDAANQKSNQKNLGTIKSSNLCVAPETLILTDKGHLEIQNLKNKKVNVWNGKEFSKVTVKQTSDESELISIHFSDGSELTCTKYHKFFIQNKNLSYIMKKDIILSKNVRVVEAQNLKKDMKLIKCKYPIIDNKKVLENSYTKGFNTEPFGDNYFVPINYSLKSKLEWLTGYVDSLGCPDSTSIKLYSIHKPFLIKIKLMLQTCGISSKVSIDKGNWRLLIAGAELQRIINLGFSPKRFDKIIKQRNPMAFVKVTDIIDENRTDKTFCFTEPKRHAGIFNGVITSQCCEIMEYSDDKETSVCNLASIGLSKFINPLQHSYQSAKVWTKNDCGYCKMAKRLLDDNNITYQELSVEENLEEFEKYKAQHGTTVQQIKTVPQIDIDGKYIGDYSTLEDLLRPVFDYDKLHSVTKIVTNNLNKVIDINFYPTEKTNRSNLKHRPVGMGIQGLADVFALMNLPFHSDKAKEINVKIFETMYHASLEKSCEISESRIKDMTKLKESFDRNEWSFRNDNDYCTLYDLKDALTGVEVLKNLLEKNKPIPGELRENYIGSYSSFEGSPAQKGILQFDMWDVTPSDRYDWNKLKMNITQYGIRNSLLLAPMPTASTSQILGNNECFEPFTSNIYVRRTLAGEFVIINKYLLKELILLDLWNQETKNEIIKNRGSIQHIKNIPKVLRDRFKIVWEIPMKHIIEMSADRGAYICQSQSLNLWMENPSYDKLTAMHFFGWKKGLKSGEYYLRTKAKAAPQQFTIEPDKKNMLDEEECLMCGA